MKKADFINYQGSKLGIIDFITSGIEEINISSGGVLDLFSGSGVVTSNLLDKFNVVSNDAESYASTICQVFSIDEKITSKQYNDFYDLYNYHKNRLIEQEKLEHSINMEDLALDNKNINDLINVYNKHKTIWNSPSELDSETLKKENKYNLFTRYYAGNYFGIKQAIEIDSIIYSIHNSKYPHKDLFFSSLFYAMKECSYSRDGHMAQPLNLIKNSNRAFVTRMKSIEVCFKQKLDQCISELGKKSKYKHEVYNLDCMQVLNDMSIMNKIDVIYADPPYTDMQYSRFYHLLNVAAKYNYPKPTITKGKYTKGLYVEGRNQSDLSKRSTAKCRLKELFEYCKRNNIILALSYAYPKDKFNQKTNRYTVSIEELVDLAKEIFGNKKVQVEVKDYKHANNRNSYSKDVFEYLIFCGKEVTDSYYNFIDLKKEINNILPSSKNPIYNTHLYWSQKSYNIINLLIKYLSSENDIIFDPFMGSGVSIYESVNSSMNRIAIGCDVNEMSKFISTNILKDIPNSNLNELVSNFREKLKQLEHFYETKCSNCDSIGKISKVVFDKPERNDNNFLIKAISYTCPNCGKKIKEPSKKDYIKFTTVKTNKYIKDLDLIQNSKIAVGSSDKISDIFTPRNFSVLNEIVKYIQTLDNTSDQNVLNYLLMSILHLAKITDSHSNSQWPLWIPKFNCVEKNIIDLFERRIKNLYYAQKYIKKNYSNTQIVSNFSELNSNNALILTKGSQYITNEDIPDNSVSLIITDPPYMDQVLYSEYMQLYTPFIGTKFNLEDEIIVSPSPVRNKGKEEYFNLLYKVFEMCKRKLKENHILCLYFHDSNLDVWFRLIQILESNGFKYISQEHIKKTKTVKNILSPKKSLSGDAVLFFENTRQELPRIDTSISIDEIKDSVVLLTKKLLEKHGDLSTPELYDLGIMEMLIDNGWLELLSTEYKSLVEIFEEYFIWKKESAKWHLQI